MSKRLARSALANVLTPAGVNFILFLLVLWLSLAARIDEPLWESYPDAFDYLHQSQISLTTKTFWMPVRSDWFDARAFTVPLFYKLVGSDPEIIIRMQKCVHALSIFFFAGAFIPALRHRLAQYVFLAGWYMVMSWWNILGWVNMLLSESLSASLLFIWLASFLHVARKPTTVRMVLHAILTVLFSFTRDSWPYVVVVFYGLFLVSAVLWEKPLWKLCAGMLGFSAILFVTQQHTAQIGQRYRLPVMNNIVLRVLPHPEYVAWFKQQGMPDADRLKEKYSVPASDPAQIYPLYVDKEFSRFSDWAASPQGRSVYLRFLLTHPESLLLLKEEGPVRKRMLSFNFGYIGGPRGFSARVHKIFPIRPERVLLLFGILVVLCLFEKTTTWILPAVLALTFAFNAYLVFVADSMEVERHEFLTMTMIQFLGVMILSLILDTEVVAGRFRRQPN
jgi:hypothetical protein